MLPSVLLLINRICEKYFLSRIRILYILCIFTTNSYTQSNLVPNSSFETHSGCPSTSCQISLATPWYSSTGCVAYYNPCATNSWFSVPNQGTYDYQPAHLGNAFISFIAYNWSGVNSRSYAQVQFSDTLLANQCYFVQYYINLTPGSGGRYATNNISACLSNNPIDSTGPGNVINVIPQIFKLGNPIITDTMNWTEVAGVYTATGGEQYITIGNFKDDANTDTVNLYMSFNSYPAADYFLDDVSVIPVGSESTSLWQYNDTSVYAGDSVFIGNEITGLNCTWYDTLGIILADSVPGIYVSPTSVTTYIVVENLCGNIRTDTITVAINYIGLEEWNFLKNITVYPNPSDGNFTFKLPKTEQESVQIKITDISGKEVHARTLQENDGLFTFKVELADGTYLLYIRNPESGNHITKRIVIKK